MKKFSILFFAAAFLCLVGAGCAGTPAANVNSANANVPEKADLGGAEIPLGDIGYQSVSTFEEVKMENFSFYPPEVTIKKGGKVTWTNRDPINHDVAGDGWQSGALSKGKSFTKNFDQTGVYKYYCALHPEMTGKITVVE